MSNSWTKNSWKKFPIYQQPKWPDGNTLNEIIAKLNSLPSLVFSGETRRLKQELRNVNKGKSFILQIGNCSESFSECNGPKIHNFMRIVLQVAMVLEFQTNKKVIKIGRVAGQYAKPRSSDFETINGINIPVYRGDIVNDSVPTLSGRIPDPKRLLEAYFRSTATLNLIRAFTQGGYSDINNLLDWKEHFFSKEIAMLEDYKKFEEELSKSLTSKKRISKKSLERDILYISHEALLLDYEEAFTRIDTTTGDYYGTSAHTLWIGDRTRQLDGAHVEFASGIGNPIGIKIGPNYNLDEIIDVVHKLNPKNEDGKIILIIRMGVKQVESKLEPLIRAVKKYKVKVIWCSDPMHGNTFSHNNLKVRSFNDVTSELKLFFEICKREKAVPGGIHLEVTSENVTECIGGLNNVSLSNLNDNYLTKVDPRLNAAQALEIALIVSKFI